MDVRLSPEQEALRASAAQVAGRLGPKAVADLDDRRRAARLAAAVESSGWLALRDGDLLGDGGGACGPVASGVEVALVAEELGRGLADTAFLGPVLAAELRRRAGAPPSGAPETVVLDLKSTAFAVSVDGEVPSGVAVEGGSPDDTTSRRGIVLRSAGGTRWTLGTVPLRPVGSMLDLTRPAAAPDAAGSVADVSCARLLSDDDLAATTALGLALTSADLVGVMTGTVELARAYAVVRRQYDAPIGSFQAVQHMLADAYVDSEGSRSVALHAAWAVDALVPHEALAAAALSKAYCARAARAVCESSVQVHGGIGNTWDCLAHVFLRRALLSSELFGDAESSVERVLGHHGIDPVVQVGSGRGLR